MTAVAESKSFPEVNWGNPLNIVTDIVTVEDPAEQGFIV